MSARCGLLVGFAMATTIAPVGRAVAQVRATLDAGGGSARIDQAGAGSIALFAPALAWRGTLASLDASGVYSGLGERGWNAYGRAAAGLRSPRLGGFRAEAFGRYRRSAHALARGTSVIEAELGATVLPVPWATVSVAGRLGSASALGRTRPVTGGRVGARAVLRGIGIELAVDRTSFTEARRPNVIDTLSPVEDTLFRRSVIEYTDASLGARWQTRSVELAASLARRLGAASVRATSWSLSATRRLTPQLALVAGTGHYAADPASSLPAGRYATLALRIGMGGAAASPPRATPPVDAGFTRVRRGSDGHVALEVQAPRAGSVELMADFTSWRPVALARGRSHLWHVSLPVTPGIHHLVVRIDGGEWRAPPGSRPVVNEFGVSVGELLVE